jgi:hypothetical protein
VEPHHIVIGGDRRLRTPVPAARQGRAPRCPVPVATTAAEDLRHELGPVTRAVLTRPRASRRNPAILALRASDVLDMRAALALPDGPANRGDRGVLARFIERTVAGGSAGGAEQAQGLGGCSGYRHRAVDLDPGPAAAGARTYRVTAEDARRWPAQYADDWRPGRTSLTATTCPGPPGSGWTPRSPS